MPTKFADEKRRYKNYRKNVPVFFLELANFGTSIPLENKQLTEGQTGRRKGMLAVKCTITNTTTHKIYLGSRYTGW